MRVLVCGSRTWDHNDTFLWSVLLGLQSDYYGTLTVIEGGCPTGADHQAADWATEPAPGNAEDPGFSQVHHMQYPADWDAHGKAAGPIRNTRMLTEGKPEMVLAFVDKPLAESKGTADMVRQAKREGVPTYVIEKVA